MNKEPLYMPGPKRPFDTVVLADGLYPSSPVPLHILNTAYRVVCCDGAADTLLAHGRVPDAVVGDCDSVSTEIRTRYIRRVYCNPDQETNDLTKAVRYCVEKGYDRVAILGATGKREDHTIGNVSLLASYAGETEDVCMATDYGVFDAISADTEFDSFPGQQVSIFTLDPETRVKVRGLRYIPPAGGMHSWWQGTLNECLTETFTILTDRPAIVFRTYQ